jgi:response regulator of citrate/malate metabolism
MQILLIEDDPVFVRTFVRQLGRGCTCIVANDLSQAEATIFTHQSSDNPEMNFGVILFDGQLPDGASTELIKKCSQTFDGWMVSITNNAAMIEEMIGAGCHFHSQKKDAALLALALLMDYETRRKAGS